MKLSRDWATPWVMGAFVVTGATGVLMFFHLDQGLNKAAHEWLGWLMLAGVGAHAVANWPGFRRHLNSRTGRVLVGAGAVLLALSFWQPDGAARGSPGKQAAMALLAAPLDDAAPVLGQAPTALRERLAARGLQVPAGAASLADVAKASGKPPVQVLAIALERPAQR